MKYFSLFSGIGGFELGLERAAAKHDIELDCTGFSEIDVHALATYKEHFDHDNFGDATRINPATLPDFDMLVAGFPCQAFSTAGERRGFDDTRGTLFFDVARILDAKLPRYLILENVRGLVHHDNGRTFKTIITALDGLGYVGQWQVLNAKDFGLAQSRDRLVVVGHFGAGPGPEVFPLAGEGSRYSTLGLTTETAIARTLTGGGHSGGNHSGMTVLRTPDGDRRLSVTEWERLQGFPDGWSTGSDTQRFKQLGNAVPPPLITAVAERIFAHHTANPLQFPPA